MVLSDEQRELRGQIEWVAFMGIRAVRYFDGVTAKGGEFWMFTQNCYGERAAHLWCHLFNSYNKDPTHYTKLFGGDSLGPLGNQFNSASVKARLIAASGLREESYREFRKTVVDFRNQYSAHRDFEGGSVTFPNLGRALSMFEEVRVLLEETVIAESEKCEDQEITDLAAYYRNHSNSDLENKCQNHIANIAFR